MLKIILQNFWLRFLVAGVVAGAGVLLVLGLGIRYYTQPEEEDPLLAELKIVDVIDLRNNPALAEAVRREREKYTPKQPVEPPPPPPLPERQISGFVQLEYTVNPDGTVSDVRVVGAAPAGIYEQQAVAQASRSMHAPAFNDAGEPVARRTMEIVEFSVPASEVANRTSSDDGG